MKEKIIKQLKGMFFGASIMIMTAPVRLQSFAGDAFDLDYLKDGTGEGGVFSDLTKKTREISASLYFFIGTVSVVITVICLTILGIKFMAGGKTKEDAKGGLVWLLIGCALVFGSISIVATIASIFNN